MHVNIKDLRLSRKRSVDTSQIKISEIFQRNDKSNIDEHIEESSDEVIELYSDDEPFAKKKKSKPIPEISGE